MEVNYQLAVFLAALPCIYCIILAIVEAAHQEKYAHLLIYMVLLPVGVLRGIYLVLDTIAARARR